MTKEQKQLLAKTTTIELKRDSKYLMIFNRNLTEMKTIVDLQKALKAMDIKCIGIAVQNVNEIKIIEEIK